MDQEVMTQLSEEVLRIDTRIDNVSDNLDKLDKKVDSLNNDAINQRVNDIANAVNNNTSIVNSMDSRIKDLENHKQAVMSERSVTRSIEISEMQEIHNEIHEVAMAVDNLDASVSPRVRTLENQASNFSSNILNLQNEDKDIRNAMNAMDVEHHEELHKLAISIDNHESRIDDIETHWINYEKEIERLDNKIDASIADIKNKIDSSIAEINNKIDSSINNIQDDIYDVSTGLANVTTIVNNLPKHIVLTKKEYDDLNNPDYNSFYFTYEDENSI